jgi:hypothetical protein
MTIMHADQLLFFKKFKLTSDNMLTNALYSRQRNNDRINDGVNKCLVEIIIIIQLCESVEIIPIQFIVFFSELDHS